MLVLSRKHNESIHIGDDIEVKIVKIRGNVVGLGIVAPKNVKVMRNELLDTPDKKPVLLPQQHDCRTSLQTLVV
jgi:carbon storage regulator CsrA